LPPFRWARPKGLLFPLYGISTLYDRSEASPIYVVEGQRDVLTLHARGLHAVSAPDGARGWHDRHTSELLQALLPSDTVNIAGDTDPAGDRWRQTLCAALRAHAGPVTVLS
jgi:DNA primase